MVVNLAIEIMIMKITDINRMIGDTLSTIKTRMVIIKEEEMLKTTGMIIIMLAKMITGMRHMVETTTGTTDLETIGTTIIIGTNKGMPLTDLTRTNIDHSLQFEGI